MAAKFAASACGTALVALAIAAAGGAARAEVRIFSYDPADDATRVGQEHTHHGFVVFGVRPEIMERI